MAAVLPRELCVQIALRLEPVELYGKLRLVNRVFRRSALVALKSQFDTMIAQEWGPQFADQLYEIHSKGLLKGGWEGLGGLIAKIVDFRHRNDVFLLVAAIRRFENDISSWKEEGGDVSFFEREGCTRQEQSWADVLSGIQIQDPRQVAVLLRSIYSFKRHEARLGVGRVLLHCSYLSREASRKTIHALSGMGFFASHHSEATQPKEIMNALSQIVILDSLSMKDLLKMAKNAGLLASKNNQGETYTLLLSQLSRAYPFPNSERAVEQNINHLLELKDIVELPIYSRMMVTSWSARVCSVLQRMESPRDDKVKFLCNVLRACTEPRENIVVLSHFMANGTDMAILATEAVDELSLLIEASYDYWYYNTTQSGNQLSITLAAILSLGVTVNSSTDSEMGAKAIAMMLKALCEPLQSSPIIEAPRFDWRFTFLSQILSEWITRGLVNAEITAQALAEFALGDRIPRYGYVGAIANHIMEQQAPSLPQASELVSSLAKRLWLHESTKHASDTLYRQFLLEKPCDENFLPAVGTLKAMKGFVRNAKLKNQMMVSGEKELICVVKLHRVPSDLVVKTVLLDLRDSFSDGGWFLYALAMRHGGKSGQEARKVFSGVGTCCPQSAIGAFTQGADVTRGMRWWEISLRPSSHYDEE
ncbi:hypothetical protein M427DRAFT_146857, partial [Gonapodya prolifera JEL478]